MPGIGARLPREGILYAKNAATTARLAGLLCLIMCLPQMAYAAPEARRTDPAAERVAQVFALIDEAGRLEEAGQPEQARVVREKILARVLEIWAVDRDRVALLWAARTLQNRLDRPTAALQTALRFLTETYRRDTPLDDDDQTRLADAVAVVGAALAAQSRAEADPEAATRCIGLRPSSLGEMIVPGVDGDDRVYLYRDGPEGQVYVAECEPGDVLGPVVEEGGGGGTALWVSGLTLMVLGGGAFGVSAWADQQAQAVIDQPDPSRDIMDLNVDQEGYYLDLKDSFQVGGGVALTAGGILLLTGIVWSLTDTQGPAEVRPLVDPMNRTIGLEVNL